MKPVPTQPSTDIPKTIWMLWFQGLDKAPEVVKACHASWQTLNPDWTIKFLDEQTYREFIAVDDLVQTGQRKQALSDIIRINLLAQYGGVWVDATSYCQVPLDTWLQDHAADGFFAFERPTGSRLIDSWFLASSADNHLTTRLCNMVNAYWRDNPKLERRTKLSRYLQALTVRPQLTNLWFTPFVTKGLHMYPYMWLSFLFTKLIQMDACARQIWQNTRKISTVGPHHLQETGMLNPPSSAVKHEIDKRTVPVYKLNWRPLKEGVPPDSVVAYLFRKRMLEAEV